MGLENSRHPEQQEHTGGCAIADVQDFFFNREERTMLPQDPYILLSFVNTKLRDEYESLESLCAALDTDESALRRTLEGLDYRYDPVHNQFI